MIFMHDGLMLRVIVMMTVLRQDLLIKSCQALHVPFFLSYLQCGHECDSPTEELADQKVTGCLRVCSVTVGMVVLLLADQNCSNKSTLHVCLCTLCCLQCDLLCSIYCGLIGCSVCPVWCYEQ